MTEVTPSTIAAISPQKKFANLIMDWISKAIIRKDYLVNDFDTLVVPVKLQ